MLIRHTRKPHIGRSARSDLGPTLKTSYYQVTEANQAVDRIRALSPKTVVVDVEPLVACWNSGPIVLSEGIVSLFSKIAALPGITTVVFATNSRRRASLPELPHEVSGFYLAAAFKPFLTARYRGLPRPGVVVGDQVATDGALAWRLGYSFVHYRPRLENVPLGTKLMASLGRIIQPLIFVGQR